MKTHFFNSKYHFLYLKTHFFNSKYYFLYVKTHFFNSKYYFLYLKTHFFIPGPSIWAVKIMDHRVWIRKATRGPLWAIKIIDHCVWIRKAIRPNLAKFFIGKTRRKIALFFVFIHSDLWFLSTGRRGTSARQQQQQEQEQQEKKVWRPPATAESSRTASLARTTRARSRNRNRFPGWVLKGLTLQPPIHIYL